MLPHAAGLTRRVRRPKHGGMSESPIFRSARAPQPLADDAVHLWLLPLAGTGGPAAAQAATARANAFMCDTLGRYVGRELEPGDFLRGDHGKPALREPGRTGFERLEFNLTHCADAAILAIADGVAVGVDVEPVGGRERPYVALARRYFCPDEADYVAAQPSGTVQKAFVDLWTAKEAVLKATGRGIAFGLDRLRFAIGADGVGALAAIDAPAAPADAWQVRALRPLPALVGAVAWRGAARRIEAFRVE